jgi:hypothetical protein
MLLALLLALQTVPQALLDQGDARNEAFVACLFSTSRDAHARGLSADQFEQELGSLCRSEEAALRAVSIRILQQRGNSAAEAADRTDELLSDARNGVAKAYRRPF